MNKRLMAMPAIVALLGAGLSGASAQAAQSQINGLEAAPAEGQVLTESASAGVDRAAPHR